MRSCHSAPVASGLRETKRRALERRLAEIAFAQVSRHGFAGTTVDRIVEEATVSRRTFSNYYACKEQAVATRLVHCAEDAVASWSPPADAGAVERVRSLTQHQISTGSLGVLRDLAALARDYGPLAPYLREAQWQTWRLAGESVAASYGSEIDVGRSRDITAVVGAVFAIVTTALFDAADPDPVTLLADLDDLFAGLTRAFG